MITKSVTSDSVHELSLSTEEFERKEKLCESIYEGAIVTRSRREGGNSIQYENFVDSLIQDDEKDKQSFTIVVIQGINHGHAVYLKQNVQTWCRQLAHIYHYYIHGPDGNLSGKEQSNLPKINIDIEVTVNSRGSAPKKVYLRDIEDDLQSLYIQSSASTFEFKANVDGGGVVEGILRYHPFLYDRETYPMEGTATTPGVKDVEEDETTASDTKFLTKHHIFECYWNGRLIPHTRIEETTGAHITLECVNNASNVDKAQTNVKLIFMIVQTNRISGALFTNDMFEVSTNKLTFMDLCDKLRSKTTVFCRVINTQEKRGNIDKQFNDWLQDCHEKYDKQILFNDFEGTTTRTDMPKTKQYPWSIFKSVEWDGKVYTRGQLAKILRVTPIQHGTIKRFLLYGDHEGDVYATGGYIEVILEPKSLYGEVKVHPLTKLDRSSTHISILKWIEEEELKLPDRLTISWPEGGEVRKGDKIAVGTTIGAIKVEITNRKGETISKLPGSYQKKLLLELKVIWHSSSAGDTTIVHHICHHAKTWPYWFKKMENISNLGSYTLQLQAVLNESGSSFHAGKELPSHRIRFTAIEGEASSFTIGILEGPFFVGVPFQVPLHFQDKLGHVAKPPEKCTPSVEAVGLSLKCDGTQVKDDSLLIKNVSANGVIDSSNGKNFHIKFKLSELSSAIQSMKIRLLPGPPWRLSVYPKATVYEVENGKPLTFQVLVQDVAGNATSSQNLTVTCKFTNRQSNLPIYSAVCNASGQAVLTGPPLKFPKISGSEVIKAVFEIQNFKNVSCVEKTVNVIPSSNATKIEVSYEGSTGEQISIQPDKELQYKAGEVITGIVYKLYDEAGRNIAISSSMASSVVVNWGAPRCNSDFLLDGKLPDINVSQTVKESVYCYIQFGGTDLKFCFIVKPLPGEPAGLKCTCPGATSVRLGETLVCDILAEPIDIYGNSIKKLTKASLPFLSVSADGLCTDKLVRAVGQGDVFLIQGVTFVSGPLGPRKLCVYWKDVMGQIKLDVIAGLPALIYLLNYNSEEISIVTNGKPFPCRLLCELRDELGNRSNEEGLKVQVIGDPHVKLTPSLQIMKTDNCGRVDFGAPVINVRSSNTLSSCPGNVCGKNCFGVYTFFLKLAEKNPTGRKVIRSPDIRLHIQPDCSKPCKLEVEYDQNADFVAGTKLTDFTVFVIAEDGSVIVDVTSDQIVMNIVQDDISPQSGQKTITFSPIFLKGNAVGKFLFSNFETPVFSGTYKIQFVFKGVEHKISSAVITANIKPNVPVKLVSADTLETIAVSNTPDLVARTIIKQLSLEMKDFYGNPTNKNGKMAVKVTCKGNSKIPTLMGGVKSIEVPIKNGIASLQNIIVEENCAGVHGKEYILNCTAIIDGLRKTNTVAPFLIPFTFYNDSAKQGQVLCLLKEKSGLITSIGELKSIIEDTATVLRALQMKINSRKEEEEKIRAELNNYSVPSSALNSVKTIDEFINKKTAEKKAILAAPRRKCDVPETPKEDDVLGKVCHLGQIEDDDIARVLSWHMGRYMDCIVTTTTQKAMEIYNRTGNMQQVLALDSLFKKSLPNWNKPLPHVKLKDFQVKGNPVYARDLLIFTADADNCKLVFGQLLGETIILDTVEEAYAYRKEVVKHIFCPTLLTRTGDRILSSGVLGGRDNKAPPINMLKGAKFAQPLSKEHSKLSSIIEVLQSFKRAKECHEEAVAILHAFKDKDDLETARLKEGLSKEELKLAQLQNKIATYNSPNTSVNAPNVLVGKHGKEEVPTPSPARVTRSKEMPVNQELPKTSRRKPVDGGDKPTTRRKRIGIASSSKEVKRTRT